VNTEITNVETNLSYLFICLFVRNIAKENHQRTHEVKENLS